MASNPGLPGATHIPLGRLIATPAADLHARLPAHDAATPVVVYCQSGRRAGIAVAQLRLVRAGCFPVVCISATSLPVSISPPDCVARKKRFITLKLDPFVLP